MKRWCLLAGLLATSLACGGRPDGAGSEGADGDRRDWPPVLINAEPPVQYPTDLFARKVEADLVLRLFVDERGVVRPESTAVVESSGYPALDSAALAAVPRFQFAPALRRGRPSATTFLQPVHFRHPEGRSGGGEP